MDTPIVRLPYCGEPPTLYRIQQIVLNAPYEEPEPPARESNGRLRRPRKGEKDQRPNRRKALQ